jgi:coproporphyrinogen III oxidase-like Fe-S oxidoreductase
MNPLGVLVFAAGAGAIGLAFVFGVTMIANWNRRQRAEWKHLTEAGDLVHELDDFRMRLEDLERRGLVSGEVESQHARLAELEERLDFAERLLARPDLADRVKG